MTDEQYYEDSSKWGGSQYITLADIIQNIQLKSGHDSYFKKMDRFQASIIGKQGLKYLGVNVNKKDKAISIEISPSKIFPFPRYMSHWNRISVVNKCGNLEELSVNDMPEISPYLQNHEFELLYDNLGNVLEAHPVNKDFKGCIKFQCENIKPCSDNSYRNSWVKVNKNGGYFEFSSDLVESEVVIEFNEMNLHNVDDCSVLVNNLLELTIENWIKYNYLMGLRNVPLSTIREHKREYMLSKNQSKFLLSSSLTVNDIISIVHQ